jgi:hypothetical protein
VSVRRSAFGVLLWSAAAKSKPIPLGNALGWTSLSTVHRDHIVQAVQLVHFPGVKNADSHSYLASAPERRGNFRPGRWRKVECRRWDVVATDIRIDLRNFSAFYIDYIHMRRG